MSHFKYDTGHSRPSMNAPRELCLLSLDGGGVRGLSTLMILKRIMEAINPEDPPNPCDYFHMICGTSTGGLIALMLGRLRMTVDQCIEAYNDIAPTVFTKIHHRVNLRNGDLQGRFDHEALEDYVKTLVTERLMRPDELLKDAQVVGSCKTFVCVVSQNTGQPTVLSSYYNERRGNDLLAVTKIWEAARATTAATSFFDSITIGDETFVDGATGANNPVRYMLAEAKDALNDGEDFAENDIKCIVSIGTGIPSLKAFGPSFKDVSKALLAIATDTEKEADAFQRDNTRLFKSGRAFRFNVVQGLETVALEEVSKWGLIKGATRNYVQKEEVHEKIKACARNLKEREWVKTVRQKILRLITPALVTLHDDETHPAMGQLQWLTHTKAYQGWKTSDSGILWYRPPNNCEDDARKGIAAAVSYHISEKYKWFAGRGLGVGPMMSRTLYYQCDRQQAGDDFDPDESPYTTPEQVLWSLICQCLVIGCTAISSFNRRLSELPEGTRAALLEALGAKMDHPIPVLFSILSQTIQSSDSPLILGLDNVHLIQGDNSPIFWNTLRSFMKTRRQSGVHPILALITGCNSNRLEEYLHGVATLDDETEREECIQSLYFPAWNARRDQVIDAEKGTNEWLWSNDQYTRWEAASSAILWIEGKPGSGKSVLAKSLQRRLNAQRSQRASDMSGPGPRRNEIAIVRSKIPDKGLVADWFYSTRMGDVGTAHLSLLRSILFQLLQQNDKLFKSIVTFYRAKPVTTDTDHGWDLSDCEQALEHIGKSGMEVVCIVDAMDEARDPLIQTEKKGEEDTRAGTMLKTLGDLSVRLKSSKMKFLVLSRPDPYIEMDFNKIRKTTSEAYKIVLGLENQGDIDTIIEKGLVSLRRAIQALDSDSEDDNIRSRQPRKYHGLSASVRKHYQDEQTSLRSIGNFLSENAEGVILWVILVIGELVDLAHSGGASLGGLDVHAKKLPRHLEEKDGLYEHIVKTLEQRQKGQNIPRARSVFMLIFGSVALGRALRVQEVWEALGVPIVAAESIKSREDPIIANRPRIKSWTGFRRHLSMICGPFVEIIRGSQQSSNFDQDDIGPDDIVQFIHRTVKDFLQVEGCSGHLQFDEEMATQHVKSVATTYIQLTFPKEEPEYGPRASRWRKSNWLINLHGYVMYLQDRILLQFCLFALQKLDPVNVVLTDMRLWGSFMMLQHCPYEFLDIDIAQSTRKLYPAFNTIARRADKYSNEAVALGIAISYACANGFVTATQNLLEICNLFSRVLSNRKVEEQIYAAKNGALEIAVSYNLVPLVRNLTNAHRHQSGLVDAINRGWPIDNYGYRGEIDPFIQLAVRSGSVDTVVYLLDHTDRFYARNAAIREFAVTSRDLSQQLKKRDYSGASNNRSRSSSESSIDGADLASLGLLDASDYSDMVNPPRWRKAKENRTPKDKHLLYAKLKQTCLRLAKNNQATTKNCVTEDITCALELVARIGDRFELKKNPYVSEGYVDGGGFGTVRATGVGMQEDAFKRFLDRNTMGIRQEEPTIENTSERNVEGSLATSWIPDNEWSPSSRSDYSSDSVEEEEEWEGASNRGRYGGDPFVESRPTNNNSRGKQKLDHALPSPRGRPSLLERHNYDDRGREEWEPSPERGPQDAYKNERRASPSPEIWKARFDSSNLQDNRRYRDDVGGPSRWRLSGLSEDIRDRRELKPSWDPYRETHYIRRDEREQSSSGSRNKQRQARRPVNNRSSRDEAQPSYRSPQRRARTHNTPSSETRGSARRGFLSALKDALLK